jgi:crotonobetainyl-CoA:carnitine CoA-transferase CaiB-like acyl-CoA transferase
LGVQHLVKEPRFADNNARAKNQAALAALLEEVFRTENSDHWIDALASRGVPCGPINTVEQVLADPQVRHREMVFDAYIPKLGKTQMIGSPIKLSDAPPMYRRPPPALGEHSAEIIDEYGLSEFELEPTTTP